MAFLFWKKYFAQWLEHCWKCAIVPSGLSYPKVTNCPYIISRNLQGTSDSWTSTITMDLLNLAISIHPSVLFSTEKRNKAYWDNTILNLLGSFPVFLLWCMHGTTTGEIIGLGFVACQALAVLLFVCSWKAKLKALTKLCSYVCCNVPTMLNNVCTLASGLTFWLVCLILDKLLLWL